MAERKQWIWTLDLEGNQKSKESVRDLCNIRIQIRPAVLNPDGDTKFLVVSDIKSNKKREVILAICASDSEAKHFINDTLKSK